MAVDAAARSRGIGTRLLDASCDHARDLGETSVRLDVIDTNPLARALYSPSSQCVCSPYALSTS